MYHEHPGRLIRGWLQANNQTQGWLAKEAGISPSIISDVLRRKRKVNPDLALRIEAVTGVVASDLVQAQARYDLEQTRLEHAAALGDQP